MRCGFAVWAEASRVVFRRLGAVEAGRLAGTARSGRTAVALFGRLHYRHDLPGGGAGPATPDGDAARCLDLFERRGADGLVGLEGDFCLIVHDLRARRIHALRDPLGAFPLYWRASDGQFEASMAADTLVPPGTSALDRGFLSAWLAAPLLASPDGVTDRAILQGVNRLGPGRLLSVDLPDGPVVVGAAWNWAERALDPGDATPAELAAHARMLIDAAVRERLGDRTAVHVSGGLDSSTVALTAAALAGRAAPLYGLSLIYRAIGSLAGEAAFVETAYAAAPSLRPHLILADDLLAYDDAEAATDEPHGAVLAGAQDLSLLGAARTAGADTILTGIGGDDLFDIPPYDVADLVRAGRFVSAWHECVAWGQVFGADPFTVLRRFGLRPLAARGPAGRWLALGRPAAVPAWIAPDFAREAGLADLFRQAEARLFCGTGPTALSVAAASIAALAGDPRRGLAAEQGILVANPLLDPRLVGFALGLRLRPRAVPKRSKPILADAMADRVPQIIRQRTDKRNFNEVYFRGLARNLPKLERLARAAERDLGIVDGGRLAGSLRRAAMGALTDPGESLGIDLMLALLIWLERHVSAAAPPLSVPCLSDAVPDMEATQA
ncbi:asparagine synthase-related protein [Prosthecomicrobium sp. N25]|uniref:asparagine synthase-related protein n=1 Tax=Prosthecomicrobium sp. N25 TaxID=3129254 RepID=UPI0030778C08